MYKLPGQNFWFLIANCGYDAGDTVSTIQMRTTLYGTGDVGEKIFFFALQISPG